MESNIQNAGDALEVLSDYITINDSYIDLPVMFGSNFAKSTSNKSKVRLDIGTAVRQALKRTETIKITAYDQTKGSGDLAEGYATRGPILGHAISLDPQNTDSPNTGATIAHTPTAGVNEGVSLSGSAQIFVPSSSESPIQTFTPTAITTETDPSMLRWVSTSGIEISVTNSTKILIMPVILTEENLLLLLNHFQEDDLESFPGIFFNKRG